VVLRSGIIRYLNTSQTATAWSRIFTVVGLLLVFLKPALLLPVPISVYTLAQLIALAPTFLGFSRLWGLNLAETGHSLAEIDKVEVEI
jgi:hypothetical protein